MTLSDVHISNSTLVTVLVVLAILCLLVWLLNHRPRH